MPFGTTEYAWNSVDVRGEDGLLHHGRVTDAVPEGLVVDFEGTGQSATKLIPFGQVYRCEDVDDLAEMLSGVELREQTKKRRVEVLLRAKPEAPWKWYPGTLLIGEYVSGYFGLVSVTMPDGAHRVMQGIVDGKRIRGRSTARNLACRLVDERTFSSKLLMMHNDHAAFGWPDDELIGCFNEKFHPSCGLMATHVVANAHHGLFKQLAVVGIFDKPRQPRSYATKLHDGRKLDSDFLLSKIKINRDSVCLKSIRYLFPECPAPDGCINGLCDIVLSEVFESMTTVQLNSLRGICRGWESLLMSAGRGRHFILSPDPEQWGCEVSYTYAASLYNCLQPQTTRLILHGDVVQHVYDGYMPGTACLLKCLMAERGVRKLRAVLLADTTWYTLADRGDWSKVLYNELIALTEVCHQVVLKKVRVNFQLMGPQGAEWVLDVRIADGRVDSQLAMDDVWAMLNNGLPDLESADVECLAQWIRHVSIDPSTDLWIVTEVLHMTQTSDPRDGIPYRGMEFYPYGTDRLAQVDAYRLTNLTLHVLGQLFKKRGVKTVILNA